jgi:uncharacterized protein (TIGR00369 family)
MNDRPSAKEAFAPDGFIPLNSGRNPFVDSVGPLWVHREEGRAGQLVMGIRIEPRHCSPSGFCHGGMLLTLADMLVVMGTSVQTGINRFMTTVSLSSDFLAAVPQGAWIEGRLEILRTTRTLIFCQGLFRVDGDPVLRVDGIVKPIGEEREGSKLARYFD